MGRLVGNDPLKRIRHPITKNPQPGPSIFVDAKDKDLPYDGQCKHAAPSIFDHPLGLKQEGALLMAILTGTQGSVLRRVPKSSPKKNPLYSKIGDGESTSDHSTGHQGIEVKKKKKLNKVDAINKLFFGSALGFRKRRKSSVSLQTRPFRKAGQQACVAVADAAIDTGDLEELTGDENIQENELHEEKLCEQSLEQGIQLANSGDEKNIPIDEYLKMVKKSTGRISYRTKLLDELALGEDIDMWVKDSELPPIPSPPPSQKSNKETKDGDPENSKETKPTDPGAKTSSPEYKGAMRATSLVVKKARRLAGLMHIEQQNHDLKDVCSWLQHLGTVSVCQPARMDDYATPQPQGGIVGVVAVGTGHGQKGDWRLPTSPAVALLMAQEDLCQRLAQLYEEKNLMETRKDQLDAAKKLVGKKLTGDGEEDSYEMLGGKISENLDDADKLEKQYWKLNEKAKEEEEMKAQKGKKGSKGKKGTVKKDKSGGETDLDEDSPSDGRGKKSRKRRKKIGKDEFAEADVFYGTSEGDETEEGNKTSKKGKTAKATKQASSLGGDSEVENDEDVGTSGQGEDDTDSGGKKDRKRVKVKGTKTEGMVELQGKEEPGVQTKKGSSLVGKDAMAISSGEVSGTDSEITTKVAKGKGKHSPELLSNALPGSESQGQSSLQGQSSALDGQNDNNNKMAMSHGVATGEDLYLEDPARVNGQNARTSTGTQAKGIQTLTQQKDFDHDIQEDFEIVNDVVCRPRVILQDEAIQTDDAVLFSLMESMMEAMPYDEQPSTSEDEAGEVMRLRRELKKAQMQLRFWRSRNWVEKHSRLSPPGRSSHPVIDSPSEAGFSFYFNAVKSPNLVAHGPVPHHGGPISHHGSPLPHNGGPVPYPMTHPSGMTGTADYATTPIRMRESQGEAPRPPQPSNVKTLSSASLSAHTRAARTSRRTSSELHSLTTGTGLVIFGRSTTLITPNTDGHSIAHLPTHENRVSRLSPRMSGVQYQKA